MADNMVLRENEEEKKQAEDLREQMQSLYAENKQITNGDYDRSLSVKCVNGTFVGRKEDGFVVYRGIPFVGEQPVGDLRWKAPVDYAANDGVFEAFHNGKVACQMRSGKDTTSLYVQGEDCLYLNIWKADEETDTKKPVMVWMHGGGFMMGGTIDPLYQCDALVKENPDVIFVSIAYRLGILGYLHLTHLSDGDQYPDAPNAGLLDQLQALKWVHENIAGFGGDPGNVTIFGESAGAGSVVLLPLIKGSHAYFRRVIAQSGSPALSRTTEQSISATDEVMGILGCKTVADLKAVPLDKLIDASAVLGMRNIGPERDGKLLPLDTYEAYANGAAADIDIMQGCNKDEFNHFLHTMGMENFIPWGEGMKAAKLAQMTKEDQKLAESFCADVKGEEYEHVSRLLDQIWFNAPLIRTSEEQAKAGGKSYTYIFKPESRNKLMKCGHGAELPTVFNKPELGREEELEVDETFAKTMRRMWIQFARSGDPSLSAEISPDGNEKVWPAYDAVNKYVMCLDEFDIHAAKEPEQKIVDWERTYPLTKYYVI